MRDVGWRDLLRGGSVLVVDIIVVVLLVGALLGGLARGFFASLGALVGVVAGGAVALWVVPMAAGLLPQNAWRVPTILIATAVLLALGAGLGGALGSRISRGTDRIGLRWVDRVLGGALSVVVAALGVSLVAQSVAASGMPVVSSALGSSGVLRTIEQLTPRPVTSTLAQLRQSVLDDGLPRIEQLFAGAVAGPAPDIDLGDPALEHAAASVARVSGVAYSCGTSSTGSGFVVAEGRIVTNAHVVAGVTTPVVEFPSGEVKEGRVVAFDPNDDLAVIAVDGLEADPLPFAATLGVGDAAVIQGYPYGGPFSSGPAGVTAVGPVALTDIHHETPVTRDVYALSGTVVPGNSGGPLLTPSGEVAGVIFARDQNTEGVGYAVTMAELAPVLATAPALSAEVSTGRCV